MTTEDRAEIEKFVAFLGGTSACMICMTSTTECNRDCCRFCKLSHTHGRIQQLEGPARSALHPRPSITIREELHGS